jgi:hypothetical protein
MRDDADIIDKIALDRLRKVAEERYALGRKRFGVTKLATDPRNFLTETIEEQIDSAWYIAAELMRLKIQLEDPVFLKKLSMGNVTVTADSRQIPLFDLERKDGEKEGREAPPEGVGKKG